MSNNMNNSPSFVILRMQSLLFIALGVVPMATGFLFNPIQQDQIRRMGNVVLGCGDIPGMSLAVVRGDDSWTLPLGVSHKGRGEAVTDATRFGIGSLTKAFTATLLLMLLRESPQGYTMDTPIRDILGHDENLFPDEVRSTEANVKDVLSHRMGLARADLALFAGYPDAFTLGEMSRSLNCLPVQAPFRDRYLYSNFMYNLAGHVIEKLSNQSFAEALVTRILEPLQMISTGTQYNVTDVNDGMATPYLSVGEKLTPAHHSLFDLKQFSPSLGLASSAQDMVRWMRAQLGPYQRSRPGDDVKKVIPDEVLSATHHPVITRIINLLKPKFPAPDLTFAYGMGWNQAVYKGYRRLWHSGTLFGFTSYLWLLPDIGIGLFITVNGPARIPDTRNRLTAFLYFVTDQLLGDRPWLGPSTMCTYPLPLRQKSPPIPEVRPNRPNNDSDSPSTSKIFDYCKQNNITRSTTLDEVSVKDYTGVYYNKLFGSVVVSLNKTINDSFVILSSDCPVQLAIRFGERFEGILLPTQKQHLFRMKPVGIFEFSAHTKDNELSTMPVEFQDFDSKGMPYSLKALWQTVEVIRFSRGGFHSDKCFDPLPDASHSTALRSGLAAIIVCVILLVYKCVLNVLNVAPVV